MSRRNLPRLCRQLVTAAKQQEVQPMPLQSANLQINHANELAPKPNPDELVFGKAMSDHMLELYWSKEKGWENPVINKFGPFHFHPNVGVLQLGGQIYEGLKAYYGVDGKIRLFRPEENMRRFQKSAARMALPSFDEEELLKCILEYVKLEREWVPKKEGCSLYLRPSMISLDTTSGDMDLNKALLFVISSPVGPYFKSGTMQPVSLLADEQYVRSVYGGMGEYKAGGNYGPTVYIQKKAEEAGCSQVLWLYKDEVTEVGTMNLFMHWINDDGEQELITPPLDGLILEGITRKSVFEMATQWEEFPVREKKVMMKDVARASSENRVLEMFGVGTACVVCPVNKILYNKQLLQIPSDELKLSKRIFKELLDIQHGRIPHKWTQIVC